MGKELVVPLLVVGVLASILLPMPPALMDFLIVGNLIWAMVLLMSTLYLTDTLKLSALPSMLLLATLYRLALNISTTRNILSSGDGGQVVEAFGDLVIRGNLVVGAVIFLIITLVQFIVIAKGSERVAEVSARFTLDALPGKQMSIDADVRAGILDMASARVKRQDLQVESRFYGALDGAMKFIKGDAIAGMMITAINIIGGLAIGMLEQGMDLHGAISKYTLLTVGDGLSAQIPALLNSLAAGIVVTRVGRGDDASLASELILQLGQLQSVKILIGLCSLLFSFVPGMPTLPFLLLAIMLLVGALVGVRAERAQTDEPVSFRPKPIPVLEIELIGEKASKHIGSPRLLNEIEAARQRVFDSLGLITLFPDVSRGSGIDEQCVVRLRGVNVATQKLSGTEDEQARAIGKMLEEVASLRATELVDDILTRRLLDSFDPQAPELVSATVPGVMSVTQLTDILRSLIRDKLSVRNLDVILQAVAEFGPKAQSEGVLFEEVRIALRSMISKKYSDDTGRIRAAALEPLVDLALAKLEREKGQLDFDQLGKIAEFAREMKPDIAVFVVSRGARKMISELLRLKRIDLPVMAYEEVAEGVQLEIVSHFQAEGRAREDVVERLAA